MSDPTILITHPGNIDKGQVEKLEAAGILVIEVHDPDAVRLTKAVPEIEAGAILDAAARAIADGTTATGIREDFAQNLCAAIVEQHQNR